MSINKIVSTLLDSQEVPYSLVRNPNSGIHQNEWFSRSISLQNLACISMLQDDKGTIMAVYPASHQLNLAKLNSVLDRDLNFLDVIELSKLLDVCDYNSWLHICDESNIQVIVDETLSNQNFIYFEALNPKEFIKIKADDIQLFSEDILIGSIFSDQRPELNRQPIIVNGAPSLDISERIYNLEQLPTLPELAHKILALRANPDATVDELAEIVALDPVLAAQVIRYANSALFGMNGAVKTLYDAIFRVLGFDTVMHLALGMAVGKSFKLPDKGPLGLTCYWQDSTYSAALCQKLAECMQKYDRPKPGTAYLAGLLHNIGILVLGHEFRTEFFWLNKLSASKPDVPIHTLIRQMLGVDHAQLGAWLMNAWGMPDEITIAVAQHLNETYQGDHEAFPQLVLLSDCLLKSQGISNTGNEEVSQHILTKLGLQEEQVFLIFDEVMQSAATLDAMILAMAA